MVGILKMSLYGTRDAAANFQREVWRLMVKLGFTQSKYNSSLYHRPAGYGGGATGATTTSREKWERKQRSQGSLSVLIHGDDFVAVGYRQDIYEFKQALAGRFTVKDKVLGTDTGRGEVRETRVLNRILRIRPEGWEYEADQRHAEEILQSVVHR